MYHRIEDIIDPEEYFFWMNICSENYPDNSKNDKNILKLEQNQASNSEWMQEYELIYKSYKLENY